MPFHPLVQTDVDLQPLTTFGLVSRARFFLRLTHLDQLAVLDANPMLKGLPRFVLGGGSNVVLTRDFPGVVLQMALAGRELVSQDSQNFYVTGAAGESWHDFVCWTLQQGWGGLENLSLIPGSLGAAPIQNIGAYGVELKDFFHSLRWFEFATGQIQTITDAQFAYRDSIFKHDLRERGVIIDVTLALPKRWQPRLAYAELARALQAVEQPSAGQISAAVCQLRRSKLPDPAVLGNVGSFFKNPIVAGALHERLLQQFPALVSYPQEQGRFKLAAGWLIEQAGWKGRALGRVGVYQQQALVLVNLGGANGAEVTALAQQLMADVVGKFGVQLEVEPVFV